MRLNTQYAQFVTGRAQNVIKVTRQLPSAPTFTATKLFNEDLKLSDARVDLGEEQLLQVNGQPREAFVSQRYHAAGDGPVGQDELLEHAIKAIQ